MLKGQYYIVLRGALRGPVSLRWLRYWRDKDRLSGDALIKTSPTATSRLLDDVLAGPFEPGPPAVEGGMGNRFHYW
ncbi:MAG: hypothetical protein KJ558_03845 [Gammaproteobacteria bacterium]|nr:hypothetical protein [Gammaproteobacteria bacterium]MBU1653956.1 hypothetical protein [Gammaproteobacteria bacterium]MBU1960160.1 hypothetical protein [Gammaproteobacteria bacterium]